MTTTLEIKDQLGRFLVKEQSLNEFNIWLAQNTWNIHLEEPDVQSLVGEIELALAEYSNGDLILSDLRERLSSLIVGSGLAANQDS